MEYQKITNLLNDASNKSSQIRKRNWVETNDDIRGAYSPDKQIRFKTAMLRSSLCDYSDAYILAKGNISVNNTVAAGAAANNTNKKVIFKNFAPFTHCISKTTQIDNAEYIDIVMLMYNLIEYSDNYSNYLETYGNIVRKYRLKIMLEILLVLMKLMLLIHLILKPKKLVKLIMME